MVYGIDVSSYQGDVNWGRVASDGIRFAWGKATEGVTHTDNTFLRNRNGARAFGIHFGGYHFAHPTNPAVQEAHYFYSVAGKPQPGDIRQMLDLEIGSGNLTLWAGTFLAELEKLTGVRPMWYSGRWFTAGRVNMGALAGYLYNNSDYSVNDGQPHPTSTRCDVHQYTSRGRVAGVAGNVDKNCTTNLAALLVPAPVPVKPKPAPKPVTPGNPPDVAPGPEPKNGNPFTRAVWPIPVPAWFWTWAKWRQDGQSYARPADAPALIPAWAWVRLKALG